MSELLSSGFTLSPGFADPVADAQACFRAVLDAMSRPGHVREVRGPTAPAPLCNAAGAVLLTLVDHETALWLDPAAAAARGWIAFHTGAPIVDTPAGAMFTLALSSRDPARPAHSPPARSQPALVRPMGSPPDLVTLTSLSARSPLTGSRPDRVPPTSPLVLTALPAGTDETPETAATLILQVASLSSGSRFRLSGPGLREPATLAVEGLPADFVAAWALNHGRFPRGFDLVLCAGDRLAALPRSVTVQAA